MPRPIKMLVLLAGLGVVASALLVGFMAATAPKPAWALLGFEVVLVLAGILGVLFGLGKFQPHPNTPNPPHAPHGRGGAGMALACIAGTIFVASVLGWMSITPAAGQARAVGGIPLTPVEGARILIALVLGLLAALAVLAPPPPQRTPRHIWRPALLGAVLGAPIAALAAAFLYPTTRPTVTSALGTPLGAVLGFLVLGALLAASVHLIVRAFERATEEAGGQQ